jgi:antitoxin ParD1/3/4
VACFRQGDGGDLGVLSGDGAADSASLGDEDGKALRSHTSGAISTVRMPVRMVSGTPEAQVVAEGVATRSHHHHQIGLIAEAPIQPRAGASGGEFSFPRVLIYVCFMYVLHTRQGNAMHINLTKEMESYLQTKVSGGFYSNASEVIRDAIRRMREEDEKLEALRAAVRVGDEQLDRGEGQPYTPELLDKMTEAARQGAKQGRKVGRDVTP